MIKRIVKLLVGILLVLLLFVGGYVIYLQVNYYRIEDNLELEITNNQNLKLELNKTYSIASYNVGFGAYSQEYSFFMDKGSTNGVVSKGKYSRAISYDDVVNNTRGQIEILKSLDLDFVLLQELDKKATRSYHYNMLNEYNTYFDTYSSIYASNFHSVYLPYPFIKPHGSVESGIVTLSKYYSSKSIRRSLPITNSLVTKFFDLDRCFSMTSYPILDKELVIINIHMSAYDEGGIYRKQQVELLNYVLVEEKNKGNYVIVGGDFNHDVANSINKFPTTQDRRDIKPLLDSDLTNGYHIEADNNIPSLRSADIPYVKNETFTCVVDGFIVSNNILVDRVYNIDTDFRYSDHNPVYLEFRLV